MLKRTILSALLVAAALSLPRTAAASHSLSGRITAVTPTTVAVLDKELVTVSFDSRTQFTKWVTQRPWQESTTLSASALVPGRLIYIALREDEPNMASWVRIATDMPIVGGSTAFTPVRPIAATRPAARPTIAQASTEDHARLRDEYLKLAAKYEADAEHHAKEAADYRKAPSAAESKRPMSPDTALHCERLAEAARTAAAEARALAAEHAKAAGK